MLLDTLQVSGTACWSDPAVMSQCRGGGGGLLKINHSPHYSFMFTLQRWKLGLGEVTPSARTGRLCANARGAAAPTVY